MVVHITEVKLVVMLNNKRGEHRWGECELLWDVAVTRVRWTKQTWVLLITVSQVNNSNDNAKAVIMLNINATRISCSSSNIRTAFHHTSKFLVTWCHPWRCCRWAWLVPCARWQGREGKAPALSDKWALFCCRSCSASLSPSPHVHQQHALLAL